MDKEFQLKIYIMTTVGQIINNFNGNNNYLIFI